MHDIPVLLQTGKWVLDSDPNRPHRFTTALDTAAPTEDEIRKAEIMLILSILKQQLAFRCWSEHHTFPVSNIISRIFDLLDSLTISVFT